MTKKKFLRFLFSNQLFKRLLKPKKDINLQIESNKVFMSMNPKYERYDIGEWTYGSPIIKRYGDKTKLSIGKYCSIAETVQILLGGEHRTDWITTYPFNVMWSEASQFEGHPSTKGNVSIGNDVWIGQNAIILSGVTIGNGAVIGAGSVITKDVPAYAIVAGNPARLVRFRFNEEQITKLERIAWWDWPIERIKKVLPFLLSSDFDGLSRIFDEMTF
jgi:acetyltransferase-like isoleucine patch superfamily enzyme